ncbi:MAG TPA: efflux RND transporter permease subunit, partial [Gemmataceae bacterium]|nr:efflux RND transporter permease subunit [Gemmataceae bacterium]
MIERVITFSIRHRAVVIAAGLLLAAWGAWAVYHTPVDAIPDLSENQVIVFTEWPGHGPREVEDQITYPLSLHLQGLAGVRVVRSSSDFGFSAINVIFEEGVDPKAARDEVDKRLARAGASLPAGVAPALGPDAAATGQIFWYTVEGTGHDPGRLRAVQDWYVKPQLQAVPGVAEVASVGGHAPEYQVELDPPRLLALGVRPADVMAAVAKANGAVGGDVVHKGNAEFLVRGAGWLGVGPEGGDPDPRRVLRDLENVVVPTAGGGLARVGDVASVSLGSKPRRGVLEKDGDEVTGGVVLMRQGENPLEVTRRIKDKVREMQPGLPPGVRIVPFYDRTPLIQGAVGTVTGTLVEAIVTAAVCVLLVLLHFRTSFVIALTLPLAVLASFTAMWALRRLGVADIQTNVMSLAGIAISVGVLVDSSVVMAENVMHHLKEHFGDRPVRGDVRELVLPACRTVGRPIFFSVVIMLLSFLPVFALGGIEGKMFRPLAFTKSFALAAVAALAVTLVPALCTIFIKGRLRREEDSWLVRGVMQAYRPVLGYFLDRPAGLVWFLGATLVVGLAPVGWHAVFLAALLLALAASAWAARTWKGRAAAMASLVLIGLAADSWIKPLGREFLTPLDEGMIMDMPITVPRASVAQSADDLKARDMVFCRFPEVDMVVGKAGRAETPTDPAPLDMIETMVNFRPAELWPRRKLSAADIDRQGAEVLNELVRRGLVDPGHGAAPPGASAPGSPNVVNDAGMAALPVYDALMREFCYQRNRDFERSLGPQLVRYGFERVAAMLYANGTLSRKLTAGEIALLSEPCPLTLARQVAVDVLPEDVDRLAREAVARMVRQGWVDEGVDAFRYQPNPLLRGLLALDTALGSPPPTFVSRLQEDLAARRLALWREHVARVNDELAERAPATCTRLVLEELLARVKVSDADAARAAEERRQLRAGRVAAVASVGHHHHHHGGRPDAAPALEPCPTLDDLEQELSKRFAARVVLRPKDRADLIDSGGELDRVMQMPGWTNVWTKPIQNRVDMLATGVSTAVGVRVLGRRLEDVVSASEDIAAALKRVPGATDVIADPVRGKGYLEVRPDREKAARLGVQVGDINELVEVALAGKVVTTTVEGRERHPVRVRFARSWREDEESVRGLPVPAGRGHVALSEVAAVRVVEGPATIKSENGLLRNYVRLNVRGRDSSDFVDEARRTVASQVRLPEGVFVEWTGQFEHEARAWRTLYVMVPVVVLLIFAVLWLTYRDLADALMMLLAVPGAVAGGVFFQWLFGYKFSVTVGVGYIACFGMATSTGIIMLVYLREAVAKAGGLENLTLPELRQAVMNGAVHRLRPKLLTEMATVLGLAPLLWATGPAADVLRPMV